MATLKERRELIKSLKVPGKIALSKDADAWLRNWRSERGINPNSGVLPNSPFEAPERFRMEIFGRRASTTPQRDSLKAEIPNLSTGGGLSKHAKDNINRPEFEKDVLQGITDGFVTMQNATEMLQINEDELLELMNTFNEKQNIMDTLKIGNEEPVIRKQNYPSEWKRDRYPNRRQ